MLARRWRNGVMTVVVVGSSMIASAALAQDEEPPATLPPGFSLPPDFSLPPEPGVRETTTVPPGCREPIQPAAVFLGELLITDAQTARFRVIQVRAGSLEGHMVGDLVDVDYYQDIRLLQPGREYLVSVESPNGERLRLRSRAVKVLPLFGGDEVASLNDPLNRGECPSVTDPIITHNGDGTNIESGVFTGFFAAKKEIAWAVLRPSAAAFALLLVLVVIKQTLVGTAKLSSHLLERRRQRYLAMRRR
jgi:hypothetical protein